MATTIEPEADPTFLAYERARQAGESQLQAEADKGQYRAAEDVTRQGIDLAYQQDNALDASKNAYRARGFGSQMSGPRAMAEDRIRRDIALKVTEALSGYQRTSQDITDDLAYQLAANAREREEQMLAARSRLTRDNAQAGVGL